MNDAEKMDSGRRALESERIRDGRSNPRGARLPQGPAPASAPEESETGPEPPPLVPPSGGDPALTENASRGDPAVTENAAAVVR